MSTQNNTRSDALITTFGIHKCVITCESNLSATFQSRPENGWKTQSIINGTGARQPNESDSQIRKIPLKTVGKKKVVFNESCWCTLLLYREGRF